MKDTSKRHERRRHLEYIEHTRSEKIAADSGEGTRKERKGFGEVHALCVFRGHLVRAKGDRGGSCINTERGMCAIRAQLWRWS